MAEGHDSLARAGKANIWRIMHGGEIQPQKVQYYLEQRDAQFEQKMREVLMVYQEISLQNAGRASSEDVGSVITVSVDEKPGVQAIANTAPDLQPAPGKYPTWSRDHEYKRHGTLSILAAVDLHNSIMIDHVMRFNLSAATTKMAELARVAGVFGAGTMKEDSAASAFIAWLARMKTGLGIPATASALAGKRPVTRADLPALIDVTIDNTCHLTNPRKCTREDFEQIFAEAI